MAAVKPVRFIGKTNRDFVKTLNKRVEGYFKEKGISKHADYRMVIKTFCMLAMYITPFVFILTSVESTWLFYGLEILMGIGMAGVGLSVMHDANHHAYSKNQKINNIISFSLNLVGGSSTNWRIQHNVLHHTYTNVHHHDEDIMPVTNLLRFSPHDELRKPHKYQYLYAWFFYGLMTLMWATTKDFTQLKRYKQKDLLKGQRITYNRALMSIVLTKVVFLSITLGLPMVITDYAWYNVILGWLTMHFVAGLLLALVFQPAHVMEDVDYPLPTEKNEIENFWLVHQLYTTCDFAHGNRILSWYVGGLNYQVEHHLFPNICHIHYRAISKIVKETASEFDLPYHVRKTFTGAIYKHAKMLKKLGTDWKPTPIKLTDSSSTVVKEERIAEPA